MFNLLTPARLITFVGIGREHSAPQPWLVLVSPHVELISRDVLMPVLLGGIGGVAGSLIFRSQDSPHYRPGIYAGMACNGLIITIVVINSLCFRRENRKADKEGKVLEGNSSFRYTI